jgi:nitrogen fixation/metabolism regulation signal transduction histidine kinase
VWEDSKDNQEFMESVMESLTDPVTMIGKDFKVKWMNRAARELMLKRSSQHGPMFYTN